MFRKSPLDGKFGSPDTTSPHTEEDKPEGQESQHNDVVDPESGSNHQDFQKTDLQRMIDHTMIQQNLIHKLTLEPRP